MKRIICVMMVLGMLLSCIPLAMAEDAPQIDTKIADKLYGIGVINKNLRAKYSPEKEMTRGEYAQAAAAIMGFDEAEAVPGTKQIFIDVAPDSEYANSIAYVQMMGIMSGDENAAFYPDRSITYDEAVKTAVVMLGYDDLAKQKGGFPKGYLYYAGSTGLLDGVKGSLGSPMTQADIFKMFDNMLEIPLMTVDQYINGQPTVGTDSGITILKKNFELEFYEGILQAFKNTALESDTYELGEGTVKIGDYLFSTQDDTLGALIGQRVKVYYDKDDYAAYIEADQRKNKVLTITANDIEPDTTLNALSYRKDGVGSVKHASIVPNAVYIYNGKKLNAPDPTDLMPEEGGVTLVDNNNDGKYEVVIIENYEVAVVDGILATDEVVKLKYNMGSLDLLQKDGKTAATYYVDGEPAQFTDIAKWSVLSFKRSKNLQGTVLYEVHISNNTFEGEVSGSGTQDGDYTVTVDGQRYKLSKSYQQRVAAGEKDSSYPISGKLTTFHTDKFGKVAAVSVAAGGKNYGYVVKCTYDEGEDKGIIRMFTKNSEFVDLDIKDTVVFNGQKLEKSRVREALQAGTGDVCQLVVYTANDKDQIIKIQTAEDKTTETYYAAKEEEFVLNAHPINATTGLPGGLRFYKNMAENRPLYFMEGSTLNFQIPTDKGDEEDYKIVTKLASTDVSLSGPVYVYDAGVGGAVGAVVSGTTMEGDYSLPAVIDSVETALDEDNQICTVLVFAGGAKAMTNGDKITYSQPTKTPEGADVNWTQRIDYSDVKITDLKRGDVVKYTTFNGKIQELCVLVKADNIGPVRIDGENIAKNGTMICEVLSVSDDKRAAVVHYVNRTGADIYQTMFINGSVYKYDSKADEVSYSSTAEVEPGDTLLINSFWWSPKVTVIFR